MKDRAVQSQTKELILVSLGVSENFILRVLTFPFLKDVIPTALLILAALTPKDYKITFVNQRIIWRKKHFSAGGLVGITCYTAHALQAYGLARRFRAAGATVVMGGPHVSALPEEALLHADGVVVGEAESVWPQIIRDFEAGTLQKMYRGVPLDDYSTPVFPYFMTLPPKWLRIMGISVTRGCKYRCEFCTPGYGAPRHMTLEQAIGLSRRVGSKGSFVQYGESNIYIDPEFARSFFRALIPLKIKWYAFSTIDIAFDAEALELARQSGCQALFIGIETIRPLTLAKNAACGIKTSGDYIRALQRVRSHGIQVVGSLIVGLDQDRHQDYWRLLGFLIRTLFQCRFLCVAMGIFTPYPGSVLFERLRKEGRLLTTRWDLYDLPWRVLYKPKTMSWWAVTLWFVVLRFVAFVCSTIGLLLVSCMLMALYINHMILIKFGTWETCYREVSHVFMSWIWILRGLQG